MKKIISLFLMLALLSISLVNVYAETSEPFDNTDYLKVISNEDNDIDFAVPLGVVTTGVKGEKNVLVYAAKNEPLETSKTKTVENYNFKTYVNSSTDLGLFIVGVYEDKHTTVETLEKGIRDYEYNMNQVIPLIRKAEKDGVKFDFTVEHKDGAVAEECLEKIADVYTRPEWIEVKGTVRDWTLCTAGSYMVMTGGAEINIGNYTFYAFALYSPDYLGIFVVNDNEAYTLKDAYDKSKINDADMDSIIGILGAKTQNWIVEKNSGAVKPSTESTPATTTPTETVQPTTSSTENPEQTSSAEQALRSFFDGNGATGDRFLFTSFGAYKDYEVCYGGYELTQPWEPWTRIGDYAFRLNVHINDDKTLLGLYLVKDSEVLRLKDVYGKYINDDDMTEIVKLITANADYENYFYLYDIVDVEVGSSGDYTIRYEGVANPYSEAAARIDTARYNIQIGDINICVYGGADFVTSENTFIATGRTKGLYVVDKENNVVDFAEAYEKSLIGTADDIVKLLKDSGQVNKGYWTINFTDVTEPVTTEPATNEPVITEPVTNEPAATEPVTIKPIVVNKKANPIKVTVKTKTVKAKKLKKSKQTVKAITVKKAQGKVSYKLVQSGITNKIRKLVSINKKGAITINKWKKAKAGTYKIKIKITAKGTKKYKSKTITKKITIKIK